MISEIWPIVSLKKWKKILTNNGRLDAHMIFVSQTWSNFSQNLRKFRLLNRVSIVLKAASFIFRKIPVKIGQKGSKSQQTTVMWLVTQPAFVLSASPQLC